MVARISTNTPINGGPGYWRMRERLGAEGYEALRRDTLARQAVALDGVRVKHDGPITDRETYRDYPESHRR